jgi:glycosyltransferase involved in cell wall biosynthesis
MDNRTPLISVIVTCYNYGKFLPEALESILAQTYSDWQCIVIDDGSKDDTAIITKKFVDGDERFRYVYQQNQGISAARNAGIEISEGEYIQFLDADDKMPPTKLQFLLQSFKENPSADIVYGDTLFFHTDTPGKYFEDRDSKKSKTRHLKVSGSGKEMVKRFAINNFIEPSAAMIKKSVIDRVGAFITQYKVYEDWHFWFRCAIAGATFVYNPKDGANCYYRFGHTSLMTNKKRLVQDGIRLRSYMHRFLPAHLKAYNLYRLVKLGVKKVII